MYFKKFIIGLSLVSSSLLFAGDVFNHPTSNSSGVSFMEHKQIENFKIMLSSDKPFSIGSNSIKVSLFKDDVPFVGSTSAKLKIFMPEMPGMPYMEEIKIFDIVDGIGSIDINFSMSGTWQYQLKFKETDSIKSVKGIINL